MSISFAIPNGNTGSSKTRNSQSVPTGINSVTVFAYPATGTQPATPNLVGDLSLTPTGGNKSLCVASSGGRLCTIAFTAPVGADVVLVQLWDMEPSGGAIPTGANLLASGTASVTVSANGSNSATITLNSVTATINSSITTNLPPLTPTPSGSITGGSVNFSIAPGLAPNGAQVGISEVLQLSLPALASVRRAQSTAGGTFVYAFGFTLTGATALSPPGLTISASFSVSGPLVSSLAASGTMNVARLSGTTYTDTGSVSYTYSAGTLTISGGSSGVTSSGVYIIYIPAGTAGSSSTSATGALAVLTVAGTTYAYVPTPSGLLQVTLTSGGAISSGGSGNSPVGPAVDACAADAVHTLVYCVAFGGSSGDSSGNIYSYNVSSGNVASPTSIATDASGTVTFTGGSCTICGIVYDSVGNDIVISTPAGYEIYSPLGNKVGSTLGNRIAENFGFDSTSRLIFSPQYESGATADVVNIGSLNWYTLGSSLGGVSLSTPDHGAFDTSTHIAITSEEFSDDTMTEQAYLVALGSASFGATGNPGTVTAPAQASSLTSSVFNGSNCDTSADGIAVDSVAHYAFFAAEYCGPTFGNTSAIGVAQMPSSAGAISSGLSQWVFAYMPNLPTSSGFNSNRDPHALTVFNLAGACNDCAIIANLEKTYLAVINLQALLNIPAGNLIDSGHTVNSSYNLIGAGVITYIPTGLTAASSARSALSRRQLNHH